MRANRSSPPQEAENTTGGQAQERIERRRFLQAATGVGVALSTAGCTTFFGEGRYEMVSLDEPSGYENRREMRDSGGVPYPIYGDQLPEATLPAPARDREITTTEFVDNRHVLMTFLFTRCPSACPVLASNLATAQASTLDAGNADEFAFFLTTFDPEYDTGSVLQKYSGDRGAETTHDSWFSLRPETPSRAETVVGETFGVYFSPLSAAEREEMDMHEDMYFDHLSSIILANADGYVERNYVGGEIPNSGELIDDIEILQQRW